MKRALRWLLVTAALFAADLAALKIAHGSAIFKTSDFRSENAGLKAI